VRDERRLSPKVVADFPLVDVSRERVRQKVILQKRLVVLGALLRSSS